MMDGATPSAASAASPSGKPQGGASDAPPIDPAALQEELSGVVMAVDEAARDWGLRPDSREGKFVAALLGTITWLGKLSLSAHAGLQALSREHREAAAVELSRVQEITRAANISLSQARNALIGLEAERENAVVRMIHETLPLFADKLQSAIVIREKSWNEGQRFKRYAMVAAATLGLVASGYTWRAWQDADATAAMDAMAECLAHPLTGNGHLYCDVTSFSQLPRR